MRKENDMKLKTILCLTLALSFSADAAETAEPDMPVQLRSRIRSAITHDHIRITGPDSPPPPPPPPPKGNPYEILVRKSAEEDGIPQSAVNAAVIALAEYYNSKLKPGVHPSQQNGWNSVCSGLLGLMRQSGDRDCFLPTIEKLGMASADGTVRESAVINHVGMCGFDSFPFMKRVMTEKPTRTLMERDDRCRMVNAFLNPTAWWKFPLSEEQAAEIYQYLLEQIRVMDDAILLKLYDMYLVAHLPEYAHSRQRLALASREDVDETGFEGWFTGHIAPVKAEIDAIPPSKRTDLRIRYPSLPPLPDDPEEADSSASRIWFITAVGVAALAAALALLCRAKKSGTA